MDLDEAAAVLYGGSPDDFVSRRTALAGQARTAKNRELAKAIGGLRRPTRSAWLVNLLARQAGPELGQLLELGDALREAQTSLAADDLRRLSRERSHAVAALARRAAALGAEQGYTAPDAAVQEVSSTLQAALADPGVAADVRAGRVATAVSYGGFGPMEWTARPEPVGTQQKPVAEPGSVAEPEVSAPEVDEERERRRAEAQEAWEQAQRELAEAEAAAEQATVRADELAEALEDLRHQVRETETAEREARNEARAARKRLVPAREAATRASRHREEAETSR